MGIESLTYPKIRRLSDKHPIDLFNRIVVSHKIDGTNGRIIWNGEEMMVGSRKQVLKGERDNFGFKEWARGNVNTEVFEDNFANTNVVVFGEFFKNPINNRVEYGDDGRFRVFDIYINSVFLDWPAIVNVADKLGFEMVPYEYMNNPTREKLEDYIQGYQDPLAVGNNPDRKIGE